MGGGRGQRNAVSDSGYWFLRVGGTEMGFRTGFVELYEVVADSMDSEVSGHHVMGHVMWGYGCHGLECGLEIGRKMKWMIDPFYDGKVKS